VLLLTLGTGIGSALFIDGGGCRNGIWPTCRSPDAKAGKASLRAERTVDGNLSWDAWANELKDGLNEYHSLVLGPVHRLFFFFFFFFFSLRVALPRSLRTSWTNLHCEAGYASAPAPEAASWGAAFATTGSARES